MFNDNYYGFIFLILALIDKKERYVWGILFCVFCLYILNKNIFINNYTSPLYFVRVFIVFCAAGLLIKRGTLHSYYQSVIYIINLLIYGTLHYDIIKETDIIYNNYESYIDGIILLQLLGMVNVFSVKIWFNRCSSSFSNFINQRFSYRAKKT